MQTCIGSSLATTVQPQCAAAHAGARLLRCALAQLTAGTPIPNLATPFASWSRPCWCCPEPAWLCRQPQGLCQPNQAASPAAPMRSPPPSCTRPTLQLSCTCRAHRPTPPHPCKHARPQKFPVAALTPPIHSTRLPQGRDQRWSSRRPSWEVCRTRQPAAAPPARWAASRSARGGCSLRQARACSAKAPSRTRVPALARLLAAAAEALPMLRMAVLMLWQRQLTRPLACCSHSRARPLHRCRARTRPSRSLGGAPKQVRRVSCLSAATAQRMQTLPSTCTRWSTATTTSHSSCSR